MTADPRLIASAPALLEALRDVMLWWAESYPPSGVDDSMPPDIFDAAHEAIRAATGQPEPDDDEGPEPPYAGYESEAQLRRMAEVRALRAKGLIP